VTTNQLLIGVVRRVRDDDGLIAAIFMSLALANRRGFDIPARRPFFETSVQLIIGVLFISISATVTPQSLRHLLRPMLAMAAALVLVAALASTLRTPVTKGARALIGSMAPRGIVAAAIASTFAAAWSPRASASSLRFCLPHSW
jgi:NhaP-type Na+/H+ or K+/H+ antiporter